MYAAHVISTKVINGVSIRRESTTLWASRLAAIMYMERAVRLGNTLGEARGWVVKA